MNTIKIVVVVLVMGAAFYGAHVMMNKPPAPPPRDAAQYASGDFKPPVIEMGTDGSPTDLSQIGTSPMGTAKLSPPGQAVDPSELNIPGMQRTAAPPAGTPAASMPAPTFTGSSPSTTDLAGSNSRFPAAEIPPRAGINSYDREMKKVKALLQSREYADALFTLSVMYDDPTLSAEQFGQVRKLADQLAGTVVYSHKHHLLEEAHTVRSGETLEDIARQYSVPWQLLAKINGVDDPRALVAGEKLKVVRGPFQATVYQGRNEVTLRVRGYYAGSFPVTIAAQPAPPEGTFSVKAKRLEQTFYDRDQREIPPGDPANPYGRNFLDLGGNLYIHGTPKGQAGTGCISLRLNDAEDVYDILSVGSTVVIVR